MGIETSKKIRLRKIKNIIVFVFALFATVQLFAQAEIVVAQDGKGNFKTIQDAINSLPTDDGKTQRIILIKKGKYKEKLFIDKNFITLRGENPKNTCITISLARDEWRCDNKDDYGTAAINLKGNDITLENLSFINSYGKDATSDKEIVCKNEAGNKKIIRPTGHQMALRSFKSTRIIAINCIFTAYGGDTVSPWNTWEGRYYFKDCVMEGGVDFYCPRGWALAENCTFICHNNNAAIWHDGSDVQSSKTVLLNCRFKGDDNFKLGRYHKDAQFYLLNCNFPKNMADADIYLVPASTDVIKWGRRVYYFNCKRKGGDYSWHKNNLPANFGINDFNIPWVFDYKWNPTGVKVIAEVETSKPIIKNNTDSIAENMLLYQRSNGGWPKHFKSEAVDYKQVLTMAQLKELQAGFAEGIDATIDNSATTKEIKYLVKAYKATKEKRYLAAAEKGISYLLKAQYANGGWPQYYPDVSGYRKEITYNDNAMVNVLTVLQDVVEGKNDLDVVDKSFLNKCADAVQLAIACILQTQVKQKNILTGWCAQHNAKTLLPAKARAYELPSLSGQESVGIIRFLMRINNPTDEIKNAISSAVAWLDKVKIVGYKVAEINAPGTTKGKDRVLVAAPDNVMWARFMDLETNEPFFCGRDGVKKKTLAEVEYERRVGYAWYGNSPAKLINEEYPKWVSKWMDK
jgi:PelA/Pel-15E family pectate lyase